MPVDYTGNQNQAGTPASGTPMTGDVTGSTTAAIVAGLKGKSVAMPGPADAGKILQYNAGSDSYVWVSPTAGSGGTSAVDKSAFTEGVDSFTPVGGVYNETLGADPTEDTAVVVRTTIKRGLHVNLRTAAGVESGTSGSPVRVDPTGTTTQPVSAAALPLPAGAATETTLGAVLKEGTDITGAAMPAGGASGRGWLSAIWSALTTRLPAALTGSGNLKVALAESTAAQTVSGTVAATQSGTWTVQPGNTANTTAWKVDNSGVTQPVSGSVSVSNFPATQPVSGTVAVTNQDILTSALRDAITGAGAAAKSLADVVTAVNAQTGTAMPINTVNGQSRLTVDDPRLRQELREIRLVLQALLAATRARE